MAQQGPINIILMDQLIFGQVPVVAEEAVLYY